MAEKGVVINTKDNFVTVKMMRQEACAKCRACIAGMEGKEMFIEAKIPEYFQDIIDDLKKD